jgi:type II secretory pathway component PulC
VIVYSDVPAQRMVFIDGQRYAEGDALDAETVIERINADGVVVKRRGVRFVIAGHRD